MSLLLYGEAKVRRSVEQEADFLCQIGWITRHRRTLVRLEENGRGGIGERLSALWPEWETASRAVIAVEDDPLDKDAYKRLRVSIGVASFPVRWPRQVNRRTAAALLTGRAKAPLTEQHRAQIESEEITRDEVLRVRAFTPLVVKLGGRLSTDVALMTDIAGDMPLPERSFAVQEWAGSPAVIVTVENRGAFIDHPRVEGALIVHCPGYNVDLGLSLIERWDCPVVHFGDFDADGLEIARRMRARLGDRVRWLIPDAIADLAESHGQTRRGLAMKGSPRHAFLDTLASESLSLEQEALVLHLAFPSSTEQLIAQSVQWQL